MPRYMCSRCLYVRDKKDREPCPSCGGDWTYFGGLDKTASVYVKIKVGGGMIQELVAIPYHTLPPFVNFVRFANDQLHTFGSVSETTQALVLSSVREAFSACHGMPHRTFPQAMKLMRDAVASEYGERARRDKFRQALTTAPWGSDPTHPRAAYYKSGTYNGWYKKGKR